MIYAVTVRKTMGDYTVDVTLLTDASSETEVREQYNNIVDVSESDSKA